MTTLRWNDDELLTPAQRAQLLGPGAPFELTEGEVLGTRAPLFVRRARRLGDLLPDAATRFGSRPFVEVADDPGATITFAETPRRVARVAAVLAREFGVRKGDRVAIASDNCLGYVVTTWAGLALGAIVTSLNGWWAAPELAHGVELARPVLIVADDARARRLRDGEIDFAAPVVSFEQLLARADDRAEDALPAVDVDEDDPALILFTSGTTGKPKGATLTHRNLIHAGLAGTLGRTVAAELGRRPAVAGGASVCNLPFFHVSGTASMLQAGPLSGVTLVLPPPGRWDPARYLAFTEQYGLTSWSGVPTQYWRLLTHPDFGRTDVSTVRNVTSGGAPFPPELMRELREKLPGVNLTNGYGATEITGGAASIAGPVLAGNPTTSGRPTPTIALQVRTDDGAVLGEGELGEICVRGTTVFLGYWNDPSGTAAVLAPDRWYRTGDFGRIADGLLYVDSRRQDLIVRAGENVYPVEIEHRLVEHPGIESAAVVGDADHELGQVPVAYVVARDGAVLTTEAVREWVGAGLAAFKVPERVEFRDSLPCTETGKVMKHLLADATDARASQRVIE